MDLELLRPKRAIVLASASLNGLKQIYWSFFSILGLVYLTDVLKIEPSVAGTILLVSLIFDGLADMPVGALLDGLRARIADYGAIIYGSIGLCSLCFAAFFSFAAFSPNSVTDLWLLVIILLSFRLCFTVFDLAENAVAARVMTVPEERTFVAANRKIAACLATMSLGLGLGWLLESPAQQGARIALVASVGGLVLAMLVCLLYQMLKPWDQSGPALVKTTLPQRLRALRHTPAGWRIAVISMLEACATTVFVGGLIYFAKAVYATPAWAGNAIIAFTGAQIIGQPLWLWMAKRYGKAIAFATTHGATAAFAALFLALAPAGPNIGLGFVFCTGLAIAGVSTMRWSIIPDIIDAAGSKHAIRVESGLIGLVISAIQIGAGLASGILGLGLSTIDYSPATPQLVSQSIGLVIAVPIIILHIVCAFLILRGAHHWQPRAIGVV